MNSRDMSNDLFAAHADDESNAPEIKGTSASGLLTECSRRTLEHEKIIGRLWNKAIRAAMAECTVSAKRSKGSVGARTCFEIQDAICDLLIK